MVVSGCPSRGNFFFPLRSRRLGKEGIVPHSVVGPLGFLVRLFVRTRARPPLSGRTLDGSAGHCLPVCGGAIAPLMKPWCAEGEVPTAANLNLYRGWKSCVSWHSDDELLFGKCGDAKLIVSVSFGSSALFRWRRQSCPDDEGYLCWLGHGDILVMDGQCQDEFLHCKGSGRDQERINVTFRWIKQHASSCPSLKTEIACCLPTCAQGSSVPHTVNLGFAVFGLSCFSLVLCAFWRVALFGLTPSCVQGLGSLLVCLLLDSPFGCAALEALPL